MVSREAAIDVLKKINQIKKSRIDFSILMSISMAKMEKVYDERGYLFEDWVSEGAGKHDGIRARVGGTWEDGWSLYEEG